MPTALIVEDEPQANQLLAMLVQLRGYQTQSAFTGGEALERARRAPPDVVLLDLMLPDATGYEVCRALRARRETCPIPVVVVTARLADEGQSESLRAGAQAYVPKPYTPDQIFGALESADAWSREVHQAAEGSIRLDPAVPDDTARGLTRFRALLAALTPLDEPAIDAMTAALEALGRTGPAATASYRLGPDSASLTVRGEPAGIAAAWEALDPTLRASFGVEGRDPELTLTRRYAANL